MSTLKHIKQIAKQAVQQKAVWAHLGHHGGGYTFQGRPIHLPRGTELSLRYAIVSDGYESSKRELIKQYMQSNLPVIELGGGLGLVSGFISEQLDIEVNHVIVEADPAFMDSCRVNAITERRASKTHVVQKAVAYDTSGAAACKLADLRLQIDDNEGYTLVCDIQGAEFDMIEQDKEALETCKLAIIEVHPDAFESHGCSLSEFLALVREAGFQQVDHVENIYAFARP